MSLRQLVHRFTLLGGILFAFLIISGEGPATARPCAHRRVSFRQRVILAPLLLAPRQRPSAAYQRVAALVGAVMARSRHFHLLRLPVSARRLGREGRRLRPRYWSKVVPGTRLLKLAVNDHGLGVLLFDLRHRRPAWRWRGALHRRRDAWRHLAQRLVDRLERLFWGRRSYLSTRVAFVRGLASHSAVYVMDYDGGHLHQISPRGHESVLPAWSPRGELTFTSYLWKNPDLYIVRGGRSYRLARYPGLNTGAAWSPSGEAIALTLSCDGNSEIYLLDRRGRVLRRLTHHRAIDTSPSWSKDGREIVFVSSRTGSPQLWIVSAQGGAPRQLTTRGVYNQEPAWRPLLGDPWIAFTHQRERGGYEIRLINAKTRAVRRITWRGSAKGATWSPDGRYLLFSVKGKGLWIVDAKGRCPRQLLRGRARTPAWSRD